MNNIIVAAKADKITQFIQSLGDFKVVSSVKSKKELLMATSSVNFDTLLYMDDVCGGQDTITILCNIKKEHKNARIIYFAGDVDKTDPIVCSIMCKLIDLGIYDIHVGLKISKDILLDVLYNPKDREFVRTFLTMRDGLKGTTDQTLDNVYAFTSIKPGSGKSFTSTNVALAIAKYGRLKPNGRPPKVAIIEADLQTLSVGTLLGIQDDRKNLKKALDAIGTIVDNEGRITANATKYEEIHSYVLSCFKQYKGINNLYALVGSQLRLLELIDINPFQYFHLLQMIADDFDVVIIDANSSLEHKTTGPILQLAKSCFFLMDLDFNNVRNNIRYRQILNELNFYHKAKYILNREIPEEDMAKHPEPLQYTASDLLNDGFELAGRIPLMDYVVIFKGMKAGTPIILTDSEATIDARLAISTIANSIYDIRNMVELREEALAYRDPKKRKKLIKQKRAAAKKQKKQNKGAE